MRKYSDFQKSCGFCETRNPSFRISWKHHLETRSRWLYSRRKVRSYTNSPVRLTSPHPMSPRVSTRAPRNSEQKIWDNTRKSNIKLLLLIWELVRNVNRKHVEKKTTIHQNFLKLHFRVWLPATTFNYKSQAKWPRRESRVLPHTLLSVRKLLHQDGKHRNNNSEYFRHLKADFLSFSLALGKWDSILDFKVLRMAT